MFNEKIIYENEIRPLLQQVQRICRIHSLPFFSTCCYADQDRKSYYTRTLVSPEALGIHLSDDQIVRHINVANGFETVPASNPVMDEAFERIEEDLYRESEI